VYTHGKISGVDIKGKRKKSENEERLRKKIAETIDGCEEEWSESRRAKYVESTLMPQINKLRDKNQYFAIGFCATQNLEKRTVCYLQKDGWLKGYKVLHQSTNPLNILKLEDDCIQAFWTSESSEFLINKNRGGGGQLNLDHGSWALYVKLAARKPNRK
jgi:hypothetical protein